MNSISHIRAQLGITQAVMADALGVTQGNISNYERGQTVPPDTAKRLIAYGVTLGFSLTYEDIYGPALPPINALEGTVPLCPVIGAAVDSGPQEQQRRRQSDQQPTAEGGDDKRAGDQVM